MIDSKIHLILYKWHVHRKRRKVEQLHLNAIEQFGFSHNNNKSPPIRVTYLPHCLLFFNIWEITITPNSAMTFEQQSFY